MDSKFAVVLLACWLAASSCSESEPTMRPGTGQATQAAGATAPARGERKKPNVLLIVVDTLGAEHVGSYDEELDHTPNIDRLAASGKRFGRAYAPAPWTQPSVASLFTSQMPSNHVVRGLAETLAPGQNTLAEYLFEQEYKTHGVVGNMLLQKEFGFGQGFMSYNQRAVEGHEGITSERITNSAIKWIDERSRDPFFLFVHYFDPHALYQEHAEFDQTGDYEGPLRPAMGIWETRDLRPELTQEDIDYLAGLHREEIAYTDHHIGRLLDHLEAKGLDEDTLVVFTSDHGEEFMRHGWIGHTRTLYNDLLRVPLLIRYPGVVEPGIVNTPVSLIDIVPTLMDLVANTPTSPRWEGISLVPLLQGAPGALPPRPLFAEVTYRPKLQDGARAEEKTAFKTAVILDDLKLIHDLIQDSFQLYEFGQDPHDLNDVWGQNPERDQLLESLLASWESSWRFPIDPASEGPEIDPALQDQLNDLGYSRGD